MPLRAAVSTRRGLRAVRSVCFAEVWDGIGLVTGVVDSTDSGGSSCIWASRSARTRARNRWQLAIAIPTWPASSQISTFALMHVDVPRGLPV